MKAKQLVISSYSDLSKLSPDMHYVHFRKFISKKLLDEVAKICPSLKRISVSRKASSRLKSIKNIRFKVIVSEKNRGRPNKLEDLISERSK